MSESPERQAESNPLSYAVLSGLQSCLTLCDPMNRNPTGFSAHGILQARILEWIAISFSRGSSQPRDRTQVSHIAGRVFTVWGSSQVKLMLRHQQIEEELT